MKKMYSGKENKKGKLYGIKIGTNSNNIMMSPIMMTYLKHGGTFWKLVQLMNGNYE